ncbi:hypothetical protein [Georgenia sp. MJ170]|uniref:hypothetical protein n=1 Tax=Georgenia sunbinii TaxID=3117728 RepID=UPI002F26DAF0
MSWRYLAQRLPSGELIDVDLPLSGPAITSTLSGPGAVTGTVPVEVPRLKGPDGRPLLEPWGSAIIAEADGQIRGYGIVTDDPSWNGQQWSIETTGFSGYLAELAYTGPEYAGVQVDPLDVLRRVWAHVQGEPGGDLGVLVDGTRSPVRIGTEPEQVEFSTGDGEGVSFEAGPFKLNAWETDDLGRVVDELAGSTPFDYVEESRWDGERVVHRLRLGYPSIGRRQEDLRFVIGENVTAEPRLGAGVYASAVQVFGAGEGRDMVRSPVVTRDGGRLRRTLVITDKAIKSRSAASDRARAVLALTAGGVRFDELTITDHPHAPVGSFSVGDSIYLEGPTAWGGDLGAWVRVLELTIRPDSPETMVARVEVE